MYVHRHLRSTACKQRSEGNLQEPILSLPPHPSQESGTDGVEANTFVHLVISQALILSFKAAALEMIFKLFNSY